MELVATAATGQLGALAAVFAAVALLACVCYLASRVHGLLMTANLFATLGVALLLAAFAQITVVPA